MRLVSAIVFSISLGVTGYANAESFPLRFAQTNKAEQPPPPLPTADEFKRLRAFVLAKPDNEVIPGNLAKLLGWGQGKEIKSWRKGLVQRRTKDGALIRQFAVDIPQLSLARPVLLISLIVPGDPKFGVPGNTTVCWLFSEEGRIIRTIEMFPERNYAAEEVRPGDYDLLGHDVWHFVLGKSSSVE